MLRVCSCAYIYIYIVLDSLANVSQRNDYYIENDIAEFIDDEFIAATALAWH